MSVPSTVPGALIPGGRLICYAFFWPGQSKLAEELYLAGDEVIRVMRGFEAGELRAESYQEPDFHIVDRAAFDYATGGTQTRPHQVQAGPAPRERGRILAFPGRPT